MSKVKVGMLASTVKEIMGEPQSITASGATTFYEYSTMNVKFRYDQVIVIEYKRSPHTHPPFVSDQELETAISPNIQKRIGVFFLIMCIGIIFGCFFGGVAEVLPSTGVFTSWELLDSPVKFTKIVHINFTGIWAQTTEGKSYFWDFDFCGYSHNNTM